MYSNRYFGLKGLTGTLVDVWFGFLVVVGLVGVAKFLANLL